MMVSTYPCEATILCTVELHDWVSFPLHLLSNGVVTMDGQVDLGVHGL